MSVLPLLTPRASAARGLSAAFAAFFAFNVFGLTPADVVGPGGIVYPDWRQAGVPGGIPQNFPNQVSVTAYGAGAGDNNDDSAAFEAAANAVAAMPGGGVVLVPAGIFYLDKPVLVYGDNVVFRGAGAGATKLYFRYAPPSNDVAFYRPGDQGTIRSNSWVEIHADPVGLLKLKLKHGSTTLACVSTESEEMESMRGAIFSVKTKGSVIVTEAGTGSKELIAEATYENPSAVRSTAITVNVVGGPDPQPYIVPEMLGAITFCGRGELGGPKLLTAGATRGSTTLTLESGHGLLANDRILLVAPTTANWRAQVDSACTTDMFRQYMFEVESVAGNVIELNQPLRIDYPLDSQGNPYVRKVRPIVGCGVEDLYLEQTNNVWTGGVVFSWAWKCWAKGVTVKKAGRHPVYFLPAKWCEIRDCTFEDAWWKGSGGSAYVGWERAYDCLMDNVTASHMRHAPLFQWTTAGSVIRNSRFYDSDAQWHSGWTNENLFEQCVIESNFGNAGYGQGMWSSKPESGSHGPNGPRNVVYNNDVSSVETAVWLGGQNKDWLFLHNRFSADTGFGFFARNGSGGHLVKDNIFVVRAGGTGVWLDDADCTGVQFVDNYFDGFPSEASIAGGATLPTLSGSTWSDLQNRFELTSPGFESGVDGVDGWTITAPGGTSVATSSAAHSGNAGLHIQDESETAEVSVLSAPFDISPGQVCLARFWGRVLVGDGLKAQILFYNSSDAQIGLAEMKLPKSTTWGRHALQRTAPTGSAKVRLKFRTYGSTIVTGDIDDIEFSISPNEIPNGDFENQLEWWDSSGDSGMSTATSITKKTGAKGLQVADGSTSHAASLVSGKIAAAENYTYQVRFWSQVTSGSGAAIKLEFLDAANASLAVVTKILPTYTTEWRQYVVSGNAPLATKWVRVRIGSDVAGVVTAFFDDLVFTELAPRPTPAVPSIFQWQRGVSGFVLENPGFEDGLTGWSAAGDNGMSNVSTLSPHSGSKCLRVTDNDTGANSSLKTIARYDVQPGITYHARFWAKRIVGVNIAVYIRFLNASGVQIGEAYESVPASATTWTQFTCDGVAPVGATKAYLYIHSYGGGTVTADFDDFEFFPVE